MKSDKYYIYFINTIQSQQSQSLSMQYNHTTITKQFKNDIVEKNNG